jgi:hypothetical protein
MGPQLGPSVLGHHLEVHRLQVEPDFSGMGANLGHQFDIARVMD